MKSPFPGMDPFIEACGLWEDFHDDLIQEIKRQLVRTVPDRYLIRTKERSYVVLVKPEGKLEHPFLPDVSITSSRSRKRPGKKGGTAVAEPAEAVGSVMMRAFVSEQHREQFVEIYEAAPDQRLVATIEVLSPTNKRPGTEGWELYQRKRRGLLLSDVHLVEIDLVRAGQRMPMLDPWPDSPYSVLVARASLFQTCRVWPAHFRQALPPLHVPLLKPDADALLELQPLVAEIYRRNRYERSIDYTNPPTPPLEADDAAWLAERLRRRQNRPKRK